MHVRISPKALVSGNETSTFEHVKIVADFQSSGIIFHRPPNLIFFIVPAKSIWRCPKSWGYPLNHLPLKSSNSLDHFSIDTHGFGWFWGIPPLQFSLHFAHFKNIGFTSACLMGSWRKAVVLCILETWEASWVESF